MNKFMLALLLAIPFFAKAQPIQNTNISEIDSTMKVYYSKGDYAEAILWAKQWEDVAIAQGLDSSQGKALNYMGLLYLYSGDYKSAEKALNKSLNIRAKALGKTSYDYSESLFNLGLLHKTIGNYEQAESYYLQCLEIEKIIGGEFTLDYALSLNNLATLYQTMSRFDEVEALNLEVIEIRKKILGTEDLLYGVSLSNLGMFYSQQNRFEEAEAMLKEAIRIMKLNEDIRYLMSAQSNLATLYQKTKNYTDSEAIYLELIAFQEKILGKNHSQLAKSYSNLSVLYVKTKEYEKAKKLSQKAIDIIKKVFGPKHPAVANSLTNLASIYMKSSDNEKASLLYQEAISIITETLGEQHISLINPLQNFATLYQGMKRYSDAIQILHQALIINCKTAITVEDIRTDITRIVREFEFKKPQAVIQNLVLLSYLVTKEENEKTTTQRLEDRLKILQAISISIHKQQQQLTSKSDKLFVLSSTTDFLRESINTNYQLFLATGDVKYLENSLIDAEFNKSVILSSTLQSESALNFGEVPDSLSRQERAIKQEISHLKQQFIVADNKKDSASLVDVQSKMVAINFKQDELKKLLEKNYPKYSHLKYHQEKLSLQLIKEQLLDEETALLEFFVSDTISYLIVATQKSLELFPIHATRIFLNKKIQDLRQGLSDYSFILQNNQKAYELYTRSASELYQTLFAPCAALLKDIKHLIIVPDGQLGHIPFEALLTTPSDQSTNINYRDLPYLIRDYRINYSYSVSLLLENKKQKLAKDKTAYRTGNVLAFAANYQLNKNDTALQKLRGDKFEARASLNSLPAAESEVKSLQEQFSNSMFLYQTDANEKAFRTQANQYAILHLAMHGLLDAEQPLLSSLVFTENGDRTYDNFLEAHEISHLQLDNDLVVLSACETGYGKFQQGEGVLSLARAFMYAGVPSLVVSLWQVNDGSTAIIMKDFYKNLAEGQNKDEALRKAKLSYLENTTGVVAHPAFWSPFIQIGDNSPVALNHHKSSYLGWILGGFVFFLFLGIFLWKRKPVADLS